MANPEIKFPCPVRRISVAWRDGEWTIENEIRIESMTLPKSAELPRDTKKRGVTGFWYEAADRQGRTIYRQLVEDPFSGMEVFDRDGKIRVIHAEHHQVSLRILVPDLPEVEELHIYSSTIPSAHGKEMRERSNAERVATFSLRGEKGDDHGRQ